MKRKQFSDVGLPDVKRPGRRRRAQPWHVVWIEVIATIVELTSPIVTASLITLALWKLAYLVLMLRL